MTKRKADRWFETGGMFDKDGRFFHHSHSGCLPACTDTDRTCNTISHLVC